MWLISLITETCNKPLNTFDTHSVNSLAVCAGCHVAFLRCNSLIGLVEHLLIEKNTVKPLELIARNFTMLY